MQCIGEYESYLLGRFFGDGWFEDCKGIALATSSYSDACMLGDLMQRVYGRKPRLKLRVYSDGHKLYIVRLWSKNVSKRYASLLGGFKKKSKNSLPPNLCNKKERICFLKGVIDAEAWVYMWRGRLRLSLELYNYPMIMFIYEILVELNVKAWLSKHKDGAYRLDINEPHLKNLFTLIDESNCLPARPGESRL